MWATAWSMTTAGLGKFFDEVEKFAESDYATTTFHGFIKDLNLEKGATPVARSFAGAFDAVFSSNLVSVRGFVRSAVASACWTVILYVMWIALRPEEFIALSTVYRTDQLIATSLVILAAFNLIPDYLALLKTRYFIRRMSLGRSSTSSTLVVDAALSGLIGFVGVFAGFATVAVFYGAVRAPEDLAAIWDSSWQLFRETGLSMHVAKLGSSYAPPVSISFYSTFLASIWLWLYLLSGWIVQGSSWAQKRLVKLQRFGVPKKKPIRVLRFLTILLVTVFFIIALPFVVLF